MPQTQTIDETVQPGETTREWCQRVHPEWNVKDTGRIKISYVEAYDKAQAGKA